MTLKYTRIFSSLFIITSLAIGLPLLFGLAQNSIEPRFVWISWVFLVVSALVLLQGIRLFLAPPTVLEIKPQGIDIYYKFWRTFSKDADLLPWQIIEKIQLIRNSCRDQSFKWAIEITLSAPPLFDSRKRSAKPSVFEPDSKVFYIDTFILDQPREKVLVALQSAWHHWKKTHEPGLKPR